jgi:hypothetical protein
MAVMDVSVYGCLTIRQSGGQLYTLFVVLALPPLPGSEHGPVVDVDQVLLDQLALCV